MLWERGTFKLLASLADGRPWTITAVNNAGEAAGNVAVWPPGSPFQGPKVFPEAVRFSGGAAVLLPPGSGNVLGSRVWGINEQGDIVGARLLALDEGFIARATLWRRSGEVIDLGALDPGRGSEAYAINNLGQAVGISGSNDLTAQPSASFRAVRPVLFENGRVVDLGGSPSCAGEAYAVNERGQAAGMLCGRAALWNRGSAVTLSTPLGARASAAFGINNSGAVVGRIVFPEDPEDPYSDYIMAGPGVGEPWNIFIFQGGSLTRGRRIHVLPAVWRGDELTLLPTLNGKIREQGAAYAINNLGQIVGVNLVDERTRAVLWTLTGSVR